MASQITKVTPGDLITAGTWNSIIDELALLGVRVTALEGAGGGPDLVAITGLFPVGSVSIGSELKVLGRNFGVPGTNVVIIEDVQITQFKAGSSDTQLIFDVPIIQGVTAQGRLVTLTVSTPKGFATTSLVVVPAQPTTPAGTLFATLTQSPPDPQLLAGQSYTFVFTVKAITNMDETYSLSPAVQAGWPAFVVDGSNNPINPPEVHIPRGDPPDGVTQTVRVRITIPAGTAAGVSSQLKLTVTSNRNPGGLNKTSGGDLITVGNAPPPPQQITVSFSAVLSPGPPAGTASVQGGVLVIPTLATNYRVDFAALIKDPGAYSVVLTPPGANWTAQIQGATTINTTSPNENRPIMTSLRAQGGAAPANLVLRVTRVGDATVFGQASQPIRVGP